MTYQLHHGDCLEVMKSIPDGSIDMVLADPPYAMTNCDWDSIIPFEPMWKQLKRITKKNGAIALFGSEPFSSKLRMSNLKMFKYDWVWEKNQVTGFLSCNLAPLKITENISIFYQKQPTYNPQMTKGKPYKAVRNHVSQIYGYQHNNTINNKGSRHPQNLIFFPLSRKKGNHPTQKPVALLQYLILTYTLENETVLDFCAGSHSTGVACINTKRKFVGIEKELKYHTLGKNRLENHLPLLQGMR